MDKTAAAESVGHSRGWAWSHRFCARRKRHLAGVGGFSRRARTGGRVTCAIFASSLTNTTTTRRSTAILGRVAFTVASISTSVTESGIQNYRSFMEEATDLIVRYHGSFSGEHGDGQSRAEFLGKMFGPELIRAFREFKSIWDPDWKMNPGKIVDPYRIDENLRLGPSYAPHQPETHFQFPDDHGSFARATLRCVGVGKCRRLSGTGEQATMCPSFMVTREERDSTRGRAHALVRDVAGQGHRGWMARRRRKGNASISASPARAARAIVLLTSTWPLIRPNFFLIIGKAGSVRDRPMLLVGSTNGRRQLRLPRVSSI